MPGKIHFALPFLFLTTAFLHAQPTAHWKQYIPMQRVEDICQADGSVWVSGVNSIVRINPQTLSAERFDHPLGKRCPGLVHIDADPNNNIVAGGTNLYYFNSGNLSIIDSFDYMLDFVFDQQWTIWVIDQTRLYRYQGCQRTEWDLPLLGYNVQISSLAVKEDEVWLGTWQHGLLRLAGEQFTVYNAANSGLPYDQINSLCFDQQGNLWVACHTYGVYPTWDEDHTLVKYDFDDWTVYNHQNSGLPQTRIRRIQYSDSSLLVSTRSGLVCFDGNNWQVFNQAGSGLASDEVFSAAAVSDTLWIGTEQGLNMLTPDTLLYFRIANNTIQAVCEGGLVEDLQADIWVGTAGDGNISRLSGDSWTEIVPCRAYGSQQSFVSLAVDSSNRVWAADYSWSGGLLCITQDSVIRYNGSNTPMSTGFISKVIVDAAKRIHAVSQWELYTYNDTVWTVYRKQDYPFIDILYDAAAGKQGQIWLSNGQSGMIMLQGTDWTVYDEAFFSHPWPEVRNLHVDEDDMLWFDFYSGGMFIGLMRFDGSNLNLYDQNNTGLPAPDQGLLGIDTAGRIWYGIENGLALYDWNGWSFFDASNSPLCSETVWNFLADSQGRMWFMQHLQLLCLTMEPAGAVDEIPHGPAAMLSVYPNPAKQHIRLNFPCPPKGSPTLTICDLSGRQVVQMQLLHPDDPVDLSGLDPACYILFVNTGKETLRAKVLKLSRQ
ncbi:MAG TPA: two-component regulator propeller domain-containing protein [Bacteroidales bacterium]|nr:two-component regulator propeller domain-containing protein [Bacteroidales bacterium]HSA42565.1 two-component regulator propeller domain-containing protein [Bacteroidales bacterium]